MLVSAVFHTVREVSCLLVVILEYFYGSLGNHEALNIKKFFKIYRSLLISFQGISPLYAMQFLISDDKVKTPLCPFFMDIFKLVT